MKKHMHLHVHTGTLKIGHMILVPKLIYRVKEVPIRLPHYFFVEIDKPILKFI